MLGVCGLGNIHSFSLTVKQLWVLVVNQIGEVAPVIKDHIERLAVGPVDRLLDAPQVLFVCLSLPGIDGNPAGSHRCSCVILRREYVAGAPLHLREVEGQIFTLTVS